MLVGTGLLLSCAGGTMSPDGQNSPKLKQIIVAPANPQILRGANIQLAASGVFADGVQRALPGAPTWQSSQSATATVNAEGNVSGVGVGVAQISASYQGMTGETSVRVGPPVLLSITVSPSQATLPVGESEQLTATGNFSDGSVQNLTGSATWISSGSAVASVNAGGIAVANAIGTISITASDGSMTGSASLTVAPPAVVALNIVPASLSISMGTSRQLHAVASLSDGTSPDVTGNVAWSSSQSGIATVTQQGAVTGVAKGASQLSATYMGVTATAAIAVGPPALLSIHLTPNSSSLPLGESEKLIATGTYSDGSSQTLTQSATWTSISSAVATVNAQGSVTGVSKGDTQVSAAYQGVSGTASVSVGPPALVSITVSPSQATLPMGETEQLTATGNFSDGSVQNLTQSATWTSSGSAVASVSAAGIAVANAIGTISITASYGSMTGSASLTVRSPAVVALNIVPASLSISMGTSRQLHVVASLSNGTSPDVTGNVAWSSSQSGIAAVTQQGTVTGVGKGASQLSATYMGVTATAAVAVGPPALLGIDVTPNPSSLPLGESEQFTATGNYSDGSLQDLTQTATWSLHGSASATLNAPGSVTTSALGTATVSATSGSVTGSASLTVTPPVVIALSISPATLTLVLGGSGQFHAIATLSNGTTEDMTSAAAWSSAQPNIASVGSAGAVTGWQIGSTTVLAEVGSLTGSADLIVMPLALVSYYSRINAATSGIDGTVLVSNPGFTRGNMCAMVYVFDQNQELNECCGCLISDSGLLTLSVLDDLTANTLTGKKPRAGEIMIVPSDPTQNPQCNPNSLSPSSELVAWGTNPQRAGSTYQLTETTFDTMALPGSEATLLQNECGYAQQLGSGAGVCSCGTGN